MSGLVLSIFPGVGLMDRAFEEAGFCVVRGPDLLWGGDIRGWHVPSAKFEGVIGGPPCQAFSRLRHLVEHNGYQTAPNLIPEFERVVEEARPIWFLMENVPQAPVPQPRFYWAARTLLLNNRWLGEGVGPEQNRLRRFSFGIRSDVTPHGIDLDISPELALFENPIYEPAVLARGGCAVPVKLGGSGKVKSSRAAALGRRSGAYFAQSCRLQGLPEGFDLPGFTVEEKIRAVNNGVPLPLGRAVARAIRRALEGIQCEG